MGHLYTVSLRSLCTSSVVGVGLLVACVALAAPDSSARKMYKWTDKNGQVHYGDQVPPEDSSQERHVMNARGVEVDRLEAAKSSDQVAADEQRARDDAAQRDRDRNLLNTYVSVQEIERLRDQRISLVSDQIRVTSQFLDTLQAREKKLRAQSMNFRPYSTNPNAPPMPDQVADDLVRTGNDIRAQQQNLRHKHDEEALLRKEFASDIDRYKQLRGNH